jgi:hypothetical protein
MALSQGFAKFLSQIDTQQRTQEIGKDSKEYTFKLTIYITLVIKNKSLLFTQLFVAYSIDSIT